MWILWSLLLIVNLTIVLGHGFFPAKMKGTKAPSTGGQRIAEERYSWRYINYTWPSSKEYNEAFKNGDYDPKHNVLVGMKVWKDKFYFALPRIKAGVPVTMATTSYEPVKVAWKDYWKPLLEPYPNWQMQKADDCKTSLQSVQGMEIDPMGRMWVLNTGRVNYKNSMKICPHRLVVFDLENKDKVLLDYEFPKDVVDPKTGLLSDIVLDHVDGGYAYITNSDDVKPSIVVFSLAKMSSWAVSDDSMKATDPKIEVKGDGILYTKPVGVNAIALTKADSADMAKYRDVYFAPLSSRKIYSIMAAFLRMQLKEVDHLVKESLDIPNTHTAGMVVDSEDLLYFGSLEENIIYTRKPYIGPVSGILRNSYNDQHHYKESKLSWMDTFSIDENGNIWLLVSRMTRIEAEKLGGFYENNFWLIRVARKNVKNYQYYQNGKVPNLPVFK